MTNERLDLEHVAHLARLDLTDQERATLGPQLLQILEYVDHLRELPTDDIEATFQMMPVTNVLREDTPVPSLPRDQALANAPHSEADGFRVPRIM